MNPNEMNQGTQNGQQNGNSEIHSNPQVPPMYQEDRTTKLVRKTGAVLSIAGMFVSVVTMVRNIFKTK